MYVVQACGFDSIPSDYGLSLMKNKLLGKFFIIIYSKVKRNIYYLYLYCKYRFAEVNSILYHHSKLGGGDLSLKINVLGVI